MFIFSRDVSLLDAGEVIAVELLTPSDLTNVRAAIKARDEDIPEPREDTPPMTLINPMENADTESDVPSKRQEAAMPERPQESQDKGKTDEDAPRPKPKKTSKKPEFDLDRFSDIVNKTRDAQPEMNQQVALQSEQNFYEFSAKSRAASGAGTGLSVSMLDRLQTEMMRCWRESRDVVNPEKFVVQFRVRLFPDGYVQSVDLIRETGAGSYAAIARQRAAAAIRKCEPYDFLPADKYSDWKDMTLSFRPRA